ncbi:MAG: DUF1801 domain-containing protein [Saprospiraceae bacterium]|nr:DUF1801 domain-containing protein [Saprospiraceae bacterium]
MLNHIENFYHSLEEPNKSCFLALRQVILNHHEDITEAWKWKLPFFLFKKKTFCYIWIDKKTQHPYIGIVRADRFEHPMLIQGDRKKMKVLPVHPQEDLPIQVIEEILSLAQAQY